MISQRVWASGTSLYNAFGDKRSLFRQALQRYAERSTRERIARLESTLPPKQALRAFFGEIVERSLDDGDRRGCLLVNSALEVAPHDPELGAEVAARLAEIEAFFHRTLVLAQADGSVPPDRDPADLARLFLGMILGLRVLARSNPERELLEGVARPRACPARLAGSGHGGRQRDASLRSLEEHIWRV